MEKKMRPALRRTSYKDADWWMIYGNAERHQMLHRVARKGTDEENNLNMYHARGQSAFHIINYCTIHAYSCHVHIICKAAMCSSGMKPPPRTDNGKHFGEAHPFL